MQGDLIINNHDVFTDYGISMTQKGLSALMAPPPMKAVISSKSRQQHGKKVVNKDPKYDERDLTLPIQLYARNTNDFFTKYANFCTQILATGYLEIKTRYQPTVMYRCNYLSCTQFDEFITECATFSLKLNEPDPTNRALPVETNNSQNE
ncbi:hypothetical protein SAMN04487900_11023 [Prevotella communis]|uniref:Uncharacterized protein n=1 Tax=Prevotella communis TaxID=2913614 RepID=A0A1H0GXI8_9BACT|nr:hypothetical protein SAMN04487900_11023 [Prevotella communis]